MHKNNEEWVILIALVIISCLLTMVFTSLAHPQDLEPVEATQPDIITILTEDGEIVTIRGTIISVKKPAPDEAAKAFDQFGDTIADILIEASEKGSSGDFGGNGKVTPDSLAKARVWIGERFLIAFRLFRSPLDKTLNNASDWETFKEVGETFRND